MLLKIIRDYPWTFHTFFALRNYKKVGLSHPKCQIFSQGPSPRTPTVSLCILLQKILPGTLPPVARMRHATVQSCLAGAFHTCGRKIENKDKTTPCHNTQLESRFTFLTLLRRKRRRTDPERTFFLAVSVRSSARHGLRNSHLSRVCEALQRCVFSHFSFHTAISS